MKDVREVVRDKYGRIAAAADAGTRCCSSACGPHRIRIPDLRPVVVDHGVASDLADPSR